MKHKLKQTSGEEKSLSEELRPPQSLSAPVNDVTWSPDPAQNCQKRFVQQQNEFWLYFDPLL